MFTPCGVAIIAILALLVYLLIRRAKRIRLISKSKAFGNYSLDIEAEAAINQIDSSQEH